MHSLAGLPLLLPGWLRELTGALPAGYPTLTELVQPGNNGLMFDTAAELAAHMIRLADSRSDPDEGLLAQLRAGVRKSQAKWRWEQNWREVALPVLN